MTAARSGPLIPGRFRRSLRHGAPPLPAPTTGGAEVLAKPSEAGLAVAERDSRLPPGYERRRFVFLICAIGLFMVSVDQTIVATALPKIGDALHSRLNWLGWTITVYSLGQVVMLPLAGRISDQFGRKKLFIICAVVFTVTSGVCGLSTSIYMLIPLRLLQSLGGGGFLPSASGIVADHFGPDRERALGLFSSIFPIGGVAGPIFGGLITQFWDWRGVFFVNLPIGALLILLIWRCIPDSAKHSGGRVDAPGIAFMAGALACGMLAITTLGEPGASIVSLDVLLPALAAVATGWAFIHHIKRRAEPIIPIRLIAGREFWAMNLLNVLLGGSGFGFGILIPLYAEKRYGILDASAGTVLSAQALGMMCIAAWASMLLRRTGYRRPMASGFVVVAAGLVLLSIAPRFGLSPYWWLALTAMVTGIGLGWVAPAANNATLALAPDQVAAISGLRATFRQSGSITSVSITTALLARSLHPGIAQAHVFWVLGGILLVGAGLCFTIPDRLGDW